MGFGQAIAAGFAKYAVFYGRASRAEFWLWIFFAAVGAAVTNVLDAALFVHHSGVSPLNSPLDTIFTLITLVPSLAVATRRLHDVDRTGWWMLLIVTGIGIALLLYWQSREGMAGANRFGPDPLGARHSPQQRVA